MNDLDNGGLVAVQADGNVDVDRTNPNEAAEIDTGKDVDEISASLRGGFGLPYGCRLRVSGSKTGRLREVVTNGGRPRLHRRREMKQRSQRA